MIKPLPSTPQRRHPGLKIILSFPLLIVPSPPTLLPLKTFHFGPGWCGSVDWVPTCEPKGHGFNSHSGHKPGLQARSPVEGVREATTGREIDVSLPLPPFPSLKINKYKNLKTHTPNFKNFPFCTTPWKALLVARWDTKLLNKAKLIRSPNLLSRIFVF